MKKILIFLAIIIFTLSLSAQKIGIKAGVNLSSIASDETEYKNDIVSLPGLNVGVVFEKKLIPLLRVQAEVLYSQKGVRFEYTGDSYKEIRLNYLQVPVSAKLKLGPMPMYALAGAYYGYAISGKEEYKYDLGASVFEEEKFDVDFDKAGLQNNNIILESDDVKMKKTDFGLNFGAGLRFGLGVVALFMECRYGLGMSDLNNGTEVTNYYKNRNLGFSAGVVIGL